MDPKKKDWLLIALFYIAVVVLAVVIVKIITVTGIGMIFVYATAALAIAFVSLYFLLYAWIPPRPSATRTVKDGSQEYSRTVTVTISVSKHIAIRKPFKILIDGKKVAEICRGKELQIQVPEGIHEITAIQFKNNKASDRLDFDGVRNLFIWVDIKKNPVPIQITPFSDDPSQFEKSSRTSYRNGMRIIKTMFVLSVLLALILWAVALH